MRRQAHWSSAAARRRHGTPAVVAVAVAVRVELAELAELEAPERSGPAPIRPTPAPPYDSQSLRLMPAAAEYASRGNGRASSPRSAELSGLVPAQLPIPVATCYVGVDQTARNREGAAAASTAGVGVVLLADLDEVDGPREPRLVRVRRVAAGDEHAPRWHRACTGCHRPRADSA